METNESIKDVDATLELSERKLAYSYDLLYDIKTTAQLRLEVEYLTERLSGIAQHCRDDGSPIDAYLMAVLELPSQTSGS